VRLGVLRSDSAGVNELCANAPPLGASANEWLKATKALCSEVQSATVKSGSGADETADAVAPPSASDDSEIALLRLRIALGACERGNLRFAIAESRHAIDTIRQPLSPASRTPALLDASRIGKCLSNREAAPRMAQVAPIFGTGVRPSSD
jgi:hypothetical protein